MSRRQTVFPSYHLTTSETEAKEYCDYYLKHYTPYMKRAYEKPRYITHTIKNNDGKGNDWNGFIVWYYYHIG